MNEEIMRVVKTSALSIVITLSTVACSDPDERDPRLLDSSGSTTAGAEEERIQRMQLVRVVTTGGEIKELGFLDFKAAVLDQQCGLNPSCFLSGGCTALNCQMEVGRCVSEIALAVASGTGTSLTLTAHIDGVDQEVRVPPQSAAVNAALATSAASDAYTTMRAAGAILSSGMCPNTTLELLLPDGRRFHELAASKFVNAYHLGKEAFHLAADNTLAVSDAELSSTPSLSLARQRAISNRALSRTAAAHLMVGGAPGFQGSTTDAFCTSGRLSGPQARALAVFREAAPSPADVLNSEISTEVLVNGTGGPPLLTSGSLKARLADAWGTGEIPANRDLSEIYGLQLGDFEAARQYIRDEIGIFSRSPVAQLAPKPLGAGHTPAFPRWAAVAGGAPERDPVYWTALGSVRTANPPFAAPEEWRTTQLLEALYLDDPLGPLGPWGDNLAEFVDAAHNWAGHILRRAELQPEIPGAPAGVREGVFDPMGLVVGSDEYQGRFVQCTSRLTGDIWFHQLSVYGYTPADNLILVRGEDLMECAVHGSIEGADCTLPDFVTLPNITPDILRIRGEFAEPFGRFETVLRLSVPNLPPDASRWYLLKARQPGNQNPGPGAWDALTGLSFYDNEELESGGGGRCIDVPIVPEAIERAARALAPSREWCGASSVTCAGTRFDERLPLEDELADDQDGVESSWRHYLALARQAATESDQLGQEYVQAGLQEDLRLEEVDLRQIAREDRAAGEMQRLQEICGTAVDPAHLLDALGRDLEGALDLSEVDQGACSAGAPHLPCVAGRRILTRELLINAASGAGPSEIVKIPELRKLYECVRSFGDSVDTHLGDSAVCIERLPGTAPRITIPAGCEQCGSTECPLGDCATCLPKENGLHFFRTPALIAPPAASLCDNIRALRATPADSHAEGKRLLNEITSDPTFALNAVRELGQSVDMRLDYNAHVTVFAAGVEITTGQTGTAPDDRWPCLGVRANNCAAGDGLFCQTWSCATPADRAEINLRLYKAALAAKITTWSIRDGAPPTIETPYYIHDSLEPYRGQRDRTGVAVNSVPIETSTNDLWRMFFADNVQAGTAPRLAHWLGGEQWDALGPPILGGFQRFTVRRSPVRSRGDLPDRLNAFWDGMFDGEAMGYFKRVLLHGAHEPPVASQALHGPARAGASGAMLIPCDGDTCPNFLVAAAESSRLQPNRLASLPQNNGNITYGTHLYSTLPYDRETLLDSLELLCEGASGGGEATKCDLTNPPALTTVQDFEAFGRHLECLGDEINRRAATAVFELPAEAVQDLDKGGVAPEARGGDMNVAISALRQALLEVAKSGPIVGGTVRRFGQDIRGLRASLERLEVAKQMSDIQLKAQIAQQITNCVASTASAFSLESIGGGLAAGVATCANSLAQVGFAVELDKLGDTDKDLARDETLAQFGGRIIEYTTTLETEGIRLSQALEGIQGQLEIIAGLKREARRTVDAALWQLSKQAGNEGEITDVLGNIKHAARLRYQRSLKSAQRMAFLAKRAIEQRLGMPLVEMVEDLPLVPAPAGWEATVCTTTGINYEALRESGQGENFADSFIGDYVTKLEQVVESYRLAYNFHEGTDTAVVSLRDDVHNVRASCEVSSRNQLLFASGLERAQIALDESAVGWEIAGCLTELVDPGTGVPEERALPDCVAAIRHAETPFFDLSLGQPPVSGYTVSFGAPGCTPATCGYQEGASLRQRVLLEPGRYRLSWYTREAEGGGGANAAVVRRGDGTAIARPSLVCDPLVSQSASCSGFLPGQDEDWNRVYFMFDVGETETFSIGFERPNVAQPEITIAAPMLEKLDNPLRISTRPEPTSFMDTADAPMVELSVCEDTSGEVFRAQKWDRNCINLCPDGYSSDCREKLRTECFWETSFHVSQRAIEAGHIFNQSGFARGNFNYRIESVGLNFVGTGLRECADSNLPSTCHAGGYVPYSIIHDGPYYVRNHKGEDYRAHLFTGHIEHARGLGTERYLTNPLGDADRSLLEPYIRSELNGRPLDGEFILRVWEEPGLNFNAIEDVQLVLNYRYWTRFN